MNLLEIVESLEKLSEDEQDYLLDILVKKENINKT